MKPAEPDGNLSQRLRQMGAGPIETLYLKHPLLARSSAFLGPDQMVGEALRHGGDGGLGKGG